MEVLLRHTQPYLEQRIYDRRGKKFTSHEVVRRATD
jgi:hypothetical protein